MAYVSTTWYTWLEQGREVHASALALDALCRALQLDEDERHYVRRLAGKPIGETASLDPATAASPTLQALVDDLLPSPAYVVTRSYDLLFWNAAYVVLYGDPDDLPPHRRNVIWMSLMSDVFHELLPDWPRTVKAGVPYLRAVAADQPGDQRLRAVIADVSQSSAEFREAWELWEVRRSIPHAEEAQIHHPTFEDMHLQVFELDLRGQPPVTVIVLYPADEQSRDRLRRWLAATGSHGHTP